MTKHLLVVSLVAACTLVTNLSPAQAQAPAAPPPVYTGSFGGGFAITGGNADTKNFNLAFALVRDPKTNDIWKVDALYLRSTQNDILSLDKSLVRIREEHALSTRAFVFGQIEYLRDRFKDIRYLVAPIGGLGYKLVNTDATVFSLSGGAGGLWEKNTGLPLKKSGSLNAGESFSHKLSSTATFTQSVGTLWKTNDFGDSLTNFSVGVTTSLARRLELKVEFLDSYKRKPPNISIKKNDTAFVTTFAMKF